MDSKKLDEFKEDDNWNRAIMVSQPPVAIITEEGKINCSSFSMKDIEKVLMSSEGENEIKDWMFAAKLKDGRFCFVSAGCDYTGWDCHSSGISLVASSWKTLFQFGISDGEKEKMKSNLFYEEKI